MRIPYSLLAACPLAVALAAAGCSGDSPASLPTDLTAMPWTLRQDIGAATVAVGGTQQLTVTATRLDGDTVATPALTFTSGDVNKVTVTAAGLVTGVAVTTTAVPVIASAFVNGVTLADTTMVVVTATARAFNTFSIHPAPTDSARLPQGGSRFLTFKATDSSGAAITTLSVKYQSLDPRIISISYGSLLGTLRGSAKLVASTTSYGVTRVDTVEYTVTYPMTAYTYVYATAPFFTNKLPIVGVGGSVSWYNYSGAPATLTFSDSTGVVGGGNIVNLAAYAGATRTFTVPGNYVVSDGAGHTMTVGVLANN